MTGRSGAALLAAALCFAAPGLPALAQDGIRTVEVAFPAGATGTTLRGAIAGYGSVSYLLGAEAGQTMTVRLSATTNQTFFTVFGPGQAPGGGGLAGSDVTGPMVPEINVFSAVLPSSGTYTVNVYQMRNAARAGLRSEYTLEVSITGATGAVVQGDHADGLQGGPDFFEVRTSGGGTVNLRAAPSTGGAVVTRLGPGTVVRNLGCRMAEGRRWCNVATLSDPGMEGWAVGEFLIEGAPPAGEGAAAGDALVPGTPYHATGVIDCARGAGGADATCEFGVIREGNGNGSVTVTWPDGGVRVIAFENGTPTGFDRPEADAGIGMTVTREGDDSIVLIGPDRIVIPDAVIWGG